MLIRPGKTFYLGARDVAVEGVSRRMLRMAKHMPIGGKNSIIL